MRHHRPTIAGRIGEYARLQQRQIRVVAPIQGKRLDRLLSHQKAQLGRRRIDDARATLHGDRLVHAADLHRQRDRHRFRDRDREPAPDEASKSLELGDDLVVSGRQASHEKTAVRVADAAACETGRRRTNLHLDARQDAARTIGHRATNGRSRLSAYQHGDRRQQRNDHAYPTCHEKSRVHIRVDCESNPVLVKWRRSSPSWAARQRASLSADSRWQSLSRNRSTPGIVRETCAASDHRRTPRRGRP